MKWLGASLLAGTALVCLTGCGATSDARAQPNPVRVQLERDLAAARQQQTVVVRYNPAPCGCPPFELHVGESWLRVEIYGPEPDKLAAWQNFLASMPVDALPIPVQVQGRPDREVLRTTTGSYASRLQVTAIVAPLAPEPSPPADKPPQAADTH